MKPVSIGTATLVYETASRCEITRHWVDHAGLAEVSRSLRSLVHSLNSEGEGEFWQQILGPVRRVAFALCSTPLPFERAAVAASIDWDKLNRYLRTCKRLYPDSFNALASLVHKLQILCSERVSPFTTPLESLQVEYGDLSVIIRNSRMNQAVAAYFAASASLKRANLVSVRQLREAHLRNVIVTIGPCGWFPDYVFSAPRSAQIHVISFRWIRDHWKPGPVFLVGASPIVNKNLKHYVGALPQIRGEASQSTQAAVLELQPVDLLPPLPPLDKATSRVPVWPAIAGDETVAARLCLLIGGRAVFVSAEEGSNSLVIDPSESGDSVVRRVRPTDLELDLYLLLRTSGGGDLIAPLADRILGALAKKRRSQQAAWKTSLISAAQKRFGRLSRCELAVRVANNLLAQKLAVVHPANIYYWMSSKCIRPRKEEDFNAILTFAGLLDSAKELWSAMTDIDRAHKRAGRVIRQMLLQKISTSSLELLKRDGELAFDLGDQDGGVLSAFQITGVSEADYVIPAERVGILLAWEE